MQRVHRHPAGPIGLLAVPTAADSCPSILYVQQAGGAQIARTDPTDYGLCTNVKVGALVWASELGQPSWSADIAAGDYGRCICRGSAIEAATRSRPSSTKSLAWQDNCRLMARGPFGTRQSDHASSEPVVRQGAERSLVPQSAEDRALMHQAGSRPAHSRSVNLRSQSSGLHDLGLNLAPSCKPIARRGRLFPRSRPHFFYSLFANFQARAPISPPPINEVQRFKAY